ncbi:hypothetical protein L9F63_027245, partial [Diploptera punctata]
MESGQQNNFVVLKKCRIIYRRSSLENFKGLDEYGKQFIIKLQTVGVWKKKKWADADNVIGIGHLKQLERTMEISYKIKSV